MEFKNKNIILMQKGRTIQVNTLNELAQEFFEEKEKVYKDEQIKNLFLSMCQAGVIQLLEKKESNIFTRKY